MGAAPAKVSAKEGGEFSYWDGDIHGTYTELIPEKLIRQDWYEHEHPERLHKVTFTLQNKGSTTTVVYLTQTDIGDDEFTGMVKGWSDYYFDPMKKFLEE